MNYLFFFHFSLFLQHSYLSKEEVYDKLKKSDIKAMEDKLNNKPRKRLNYLTSYKVFVKKMKMEDFWIQTLI